MATLTSPPSASAGLIHVVLGAISATDTWHGEPTLDAFERLLEAVDEEDADALAGAVGECLLPLRGAPEHCSLALDLIRTFDLFEAAPGLASLVREAPTRKALVTAASMATHPAVASSLGEVAQLALQRYDAPELHKRVRFLLDGHLPGGASEADAWLYAERWPGRVSLDETSAPLVVVTTEAADVHDVLRFTLECRRAGAQVRRVPPDAEQPPDGWLPVETGVLVARDQRPAWWPDRPLRESPVLFTHGSLSIGRRRALLRRAGRVFSGNLRLRQSETRGWVEELADPLTDVEAFLQGALMVPEVHMLTGWSGSTIRQRGRDHRELRPHSPSSVMGVYFDFGQVTALRVERYVSATFGRRPSKELAPKLVRDVRERRSTPICITDQGEVLFEEDEHTLRDVHGQGSFRTVRLAEVAERFDLGGGRTVPDLLHPSAQTRVHPAVQRGTPVVSGTRIPATAVREVMNRGIAGGMAGQELVEWTQGHYPELNAEQIHDAHKLGEQILA